MSSVRRGGAVYRNGFGQRPDDERGEFQGKRHGDL